MTFMRSTKRYLSILLTALFMLTSMASLQAQAAMVKFHGAEGCQVVRGSVQLWPVQ